MIGVLVILFSRTIVFPGLEITLGIETIVGRENVSYQPDGSYYFTNPGAMQRWILSVAGIGLAIVALGVFGIRQAGRARRELAAAPNGGSATRSDNSAARGGPPSVAER